MQHSCGDHSSRGVASRAFRLSTRPCAGHRARLQIYRPAPLVPFRCGPDGVDEASAPPSSSALLGASFTGVEASMVCTNDGASRPWAPVLVERVIALRAELESHEKWTRARTHVGLTRPLTLKKRSVATPLATSPLTPDARQATGGESATATREGRQPAAGFRAPSSPRIPGRRRGSSSRAGMLNPNVHRLARSANCGLGLDDAFRQDAAEGGATRDPAHIGALSPAYGCRALKYVGRLALHTISHLPKLNDRTQRVRVLRR